MTRANEGEVPVKVNLEIPDENYTSLPIAEVSVVYPAFVPTQPVGVNASVEIVK